MAEEITTVEEAQQILSEFLSDRERLDQSSEGGDIYDDILWMILRNMTLDQVRRQLRMRLKHPILPVY